MRDWAVTIVATTNISKFDIPEIHFFKQYLVRGNVEEISVEEYAKLDEKNARWSPIFSDI